MSNVVTIARTAAVESSATGSAASDGPLTVASRRVWNVPFRQTVPEAVESPGTWYRPRANPA